MTRQQNICNHDDSNARLCAAKRQGRRDLPTDERMLLSTVKLLRVQVAEMKQVRLIFNNNTIWHLRVRSKCDDLAIRPSALPDKT